MSVEAMKAGAVEFLTKPGATKTFWTRFVLRLSGASQQRDRDNALTALRCPSRALTDSEREVMALVVKGSLNKEISAELGISEVTVKVHRHNLMAKLG